MKRLVPALAAAVCLCTPAAAPAAGGSNWPSVSASFSYAPTFPVTGQTVSFTSTSVVSGYHNQIASQAWDLDNDGRFTDATGPTASRSFATAGSYTVALQVTDRYHNSAVAFQTLTVQNPPPPPLLTPFPFVRMSGTIKRSGTRVRRLIVDAPPGSTISTRCRGRGCPPRHRARTAASSAAGNVHALRVVHLRRFERRLLRPGVVLKVLITRAGTIGKYTRFEIRRGKPPAREDRCLTPSSGKVERCPSR